MTHPALRALRVTALGLALATTATAQPVEVDWSGLAWVDYAYTIADPDPDLDGANSFDYRRIYLTADARLDDAVRMRVRLEAQGRATTDAGRPSPFVKDAWIRWQYAESGHRAQIGVQPPPLFEVTEAVWGYRSLDQTILDRSVRSSRDFGLRLDGPLALGGDLRYQAMVGNGRGVRPEARGEGGKHAYGRIAYVPSDSPLRVTVGGDYTTRLPVMPEDEAPTAPLRESSALGSAMVGFVTDGARGGVEAFAIRDEVGETDSEGGFGLSVFGAYDPTPQTSLIARYDLLDGAASDGAGAEHYLLAAVAYRPVPALEIMPNVVATFPDGLDATVLGRVTVAARF